MKQTKSMIKDQSAPHPGMSVDTYCVVDWFRMLHAMGTHDVCQGRHANPKPDVLVIAVIVCII